MTEESYSFTMRHYDGTLVTLTGNKSTLSDIIEDFKAFLLGCTFNESLVNKIYYGDAEEYNGN